MRTKRLFLASRHRLVLTLFALALAVGSLSLAGDLPPDGAAAVVVDGGSVGNR